MLLLYQVGSVKIGEVVRYTVTYVPSQDRILPSPEFLYLRIRNTSAIALRAAFVHGPYTLCVAAYPAAYNPNEKFAEPRRYGVPEFEPMLKAGGAWNCHLVVPEHIRQSAGAGASRGHFGAGPEHDNDSVSWIIEVASQVIFSSSAAVNYEIVLARDEKSLNLSSPAPVVGGQAQVAQPGRVSDHQRAKPHHQPKGVFSRAIRLAVEDTAELWNKPALPGWDEDRRVRAAERGTYVPLDPQPGESGAEEAPKKQKRVHLVILTHGIHGNLGVDLLFLKESIDAGVKQAKSDARARRARERAEERRGVTAEEGEVCSGSGREAGIEVKEEEDEDDEEVIVRGFSGNATRTERGIKFLGKRLARYILSMTYPDQPFLPAAKVASGMVSHTVKGGTKQHDLAGVPVHKHSKILQTPSFSSTKRMYKIAKISLVGHSLGGLVQTYAVAYIQKHSPEFFDRIEPINFIALASPFLGLNHENPLYVKFALDFGFVGRTGQDLGLTWRAPTIARSGWGAIVGNLGENAHKRVLGEAQPESKPLLRILPTGPAHTALKKFRNRTVYSNVVNDGIVPLRTSCLLFLDWQGLGRVEKARREGGLVETVVGFGWAELTGANVTSPRPKPWTPAEEVEEVGDGNSTPTDIPDSHQVPQPPSNATLEDDKQSLRSAVGTPYHEATMQNAEKYSTATTNNNPNPFSGFFNFFRSSDPPKESPPSQKQNRIYQRSQTRQSDMEVSNASSSRTKVTSGSELSEESESGVSAPPRTSFFESASDLMNPKLPSMEYLIDPTQRPRTIFHDRVYHPLDIPPPPLKKRPTGSLLRRRSYARTNSANSSQQTSGSTSSSPFPSPRLPHHEDSGLSTRDYDDTVHTNPDKDPNEVIDRSGMKVEEKIARAYHKGLSWRKVLVKLEPDAHNNIIVRRMFANAFGWPVVKHLVDAHFSDSAAARTRDEEEAGVERARPPTEAPDEHGAETTTQDADSKDAGGPADRDVGEPELARAQLPLRSMEQPEMSPSEESEAFDKVPDLPTPSQHKSDDDVTLSSSLKHSVQRPGYDRLDSVTWSERDWDDSADESDDESEEAQGARHGHQDHAEGDKDKGTEKGESASHSSQWDWTEKIVGKGAAMHQAKSPKPDVSLEDSPKPTDVD